MGHDNIGYPRILYYFQLFFVKFFCKFSDVPPSARPAMQNRHCFHVSCFVFHISASECQLDAYWRVVAAHGIGVDFGCFNFELQAFRGQEIIYTPADIPRPGIGPMRPPTVMAIAFVEQPESVDKPRVNIFLESLALFFSKALFAFVLFWPG